MKKLLLLGIGSALAFTMGGVGPAQADNGPHQKVDLETSVTPDGCAGCHRLHSAKTDMLTIDVQPALCYTCHGTTGTGAITDVQNGVGYTANADGKRSRPKAGALRGGGFEYALIDSANPTGQSGTGATKKIPPLDVTLSGTVGTETTSSHSVTGDDAMAWGQGVIGTATVGNTIQLRCGSCHDPHGNGNYRILRPMPEQGTASPGITNVGAVSPAVAPVFSGVIADTTVKNYTTTNYWTTDDVNSPIVNPSALSVDQRTDFITNISQWCSQCHTRYLASRDSGFTRDTPPVAKPFITNPNQRSRVDSGDATFMYRHTSSEVKAGGKNCITCHVSHGSNAATGEFSGVLKTPGASGVKVIGDSRLLRVDNRGICLMCHGM